MYFGLGFKFKGSERPSTWSLRSRSNSSKSNSSKSNSSSALMSCWASGVQHCYWNTQRHRTHGYESYSAHTNAFKSMKIAESKPLLREVHSYQSTTDRRPMAVNGIQHRNPKWEGTDKLRPKGSIQICMMPVQSWLERFRPAQRTETNRSINAIVTKERILQIFEKR